VNTRTKLNICLNTIKRISYWPCWLSSLRGLLRFLGEVVFVVFVIPAMPIFDFKEIFGFIGIPLEVIVQYNISFSISQPIYAISIQQSHDKYSKSLLCQIFHCAMLNFGYELLSHPNVNCIYQLALSFCVCVCMCVCIHWHKHLKCHLTIAFT